MERANKTIAIFWERKKKTYSKYQKRFCICSNLHCLKFLPFILSVKAWAWFLRSLVSWSQLPFIQWQFLNSLKKLQQYYFLSRTKQSFVISTIMWAKNRKRHYALKIYSSFISDRKRWVHIDKRFRSRPFLKEGLTSFIIDKTFGLIRASLYFWCTQKF